MAHAGPRAWPCAPHALRQHFFGRQREGADPSESCINVRRVKVIPTNFLFSGEVTSAANIAQYGAVVNIFSMPRKMTESRGSRRLSAFAGSFVFKQLVTVTLPFLLRCLLAKLGETLQ